MVLERFLSVLARRAARLCLRLLLELALERPVALRSRWALELGVSSARSRRSSALCLGCPQLVIGVGVVVLNVATEKGFKVGFNDARALWVRKPCVGHDAYRILVRSLRLLHELRVKPGVRAYVLVCANYRYKHNGKSDGQEQICRHNFFILLLSQQKERCGRGLGLCRRQCQPGS